MKGNIPKSWNTVKLKRKETIAETILCRNEFPMWGGTEKACNLR